MMFKVDRVVPLLKKSVTSVDDMPNYRQFANLNMIRKILENLAIKQIGHHMESTVNIAWMQSAHRGLHLTETAMRIVNTLLIAADNKAPSMLLSLGISEAFHTLDHCRLVKFSRETFGLDDVMLLFSYGNILI